MVKVVRGRYYIALLDKPKCRLDSSIKWRKKRTVTEADTTPEKSMDPDSRSNIKTITFKNAYNIIHIGVLGKNILIIPLFSAFVSGCSFYYGSGSGNQVRILWLGQDYLFRWDIFSLELLLSKVIFPYYFILEIFGEYWII